MYIRVPWVLAECDILSVLCSGNVSDTPNFLLYTGLEMCTKCHLSCFPVFLTCQKVPSGNVIEMYLKFCPIATVPVGKVKKISNFPGVVNVYTMNRKCDYPAHFVGFPGPGSLGCLPVNSNKILAHEHPYHIAHASIQDNCNFFTKITFLYKQYVIS